MNHDVYALSASVVNEMLLVVDRFAVNELSTLFHSIRRDKLFPLFSIPPTLRQAYDVILRASLLIDFEVLRLI